VATLVALASEESSTPASLAASESLGALRKELASWLEGHGYDGFSVVDRHRKIVAAQRDELVGREDLPIQEGLLEQPLSGKTTVSRPFQSEILLSTETGHVRAEVPTMFVVAPVRDSDDEIIAVIGFRIRPDADFTRILSVARAGESGETYAFDKQGVLISQSRFDDDLKQIGLLVDKDEVHSILNIQIRDPQADMTLGERPKLRRAKQPLTRIAASATLGKSDADVEGYRDYRGVPVVGAWTWLKEYEFGVTTEVDVAEAYRPLYVLRYAFWGIFVLLAASEVAIFVFTIIVSKLNRTARKAALEAKQLGQYELEEKIGAGGMGVVYKACHSMLRRPTALKLLDIDKTTDATIARFEREVRLTSQLNHPNTIAVYDFGRTPEGIFYYAMEYLDGVTLDDLVEQHGPQPEGRVIHILNQLCGSLIEAHGVGLIHRDVKPANIIINRRGGMFDVVKLLDFGLVKAVDAARETALTAAGSITGTPLYVSPEGIERPDDVDARSDLYAVGAVGYFLLTGQPVFEGQSVVEICMHQVQTPPLPPSERLGTAISTDLENVILKCLAKSPSYRPQTATELLTVLTACSSAGNWTTEDAQAWWQDPSSTKTDTQPAAESATVSHSQTVIMNRDDAMNE
jgi:serine/threonine protein kinase